MNVLCASSVHPKRFYCMYYVHHDCLLMYPLVLDVLCASSLSPEVHYGMVLDVFCASSASHCLLMYPVVLNVLCAPSLYPHCILFVSSLYPHLPHGIGCITCIQLYPHVYYGIGFIMYIPLYPDVPYGIGCIMCIPLSPHVPYGIGCTMCREGVRLYCISRFWRRTWRMPRPPSCPAQSKKWVYDEEQRGKEVGETWDVPDDCLRSFGFDR